MAALAIEVDSAPCAAVAAFTVAIVLADDVGLLNGVDGLAAKKETVMPPVLPVLTAACFAVAVNGT